MSLYQRKTNMTTQELEEALAAKTQRCERLEKELFIVRTLAQERIQRCERLEKALREIADCPGKCCVTCQTKARLAINKEPR